MKASLTMPFKISALGVSAIAAYSLKSGWLYQSIAMSKGASDYEETGFLRSSEDPRHLKMAINRKSASSIRADSHSRGSEQAAGLLEKASSNNGLLNSGSMLSNCVRTANTALAVSGTVN